jgi:hypothetical protein
MFKKGSKKGLNKGRESIGGGESTCGPAFVRSRLSFSVVVCLLPCLLLFWKWLS